MIPKPTVCFMGLGIDIWESFLNFQESTKPSIVNGYEIHSLISFLLSRLHHHRPISVPPPPPPPPRLCASTITVQSLRLHHRVFVPPPAPSLFCVASTIIVRSLRLHHHCRVFVPPPSVRLASSLRLHVMEQEEGVRGRGKNKCFWREEEVEALIEVLQDLACDPSWKTDCGFKSNYMNEVHKKILIKIPTFSKQVTPHLESKIKWLKTKFHVINDMLRESGCQWNDVEQKIACERQWFDSYCKNHKEAKGMWDFKFPYLNKLEMVYGKDRATGAAVQGFGDAVRTMEAEEKNESGGESLGDFYNFSLEEDNDAFSESQSTPTAKNMATKNKRPAATSEDRVAKRKRPMTSLDVGGQLAEINAGFRTFVEGFTSNFGTIANAMAEENMREKAASQRMKDAIDELMNLNLPSADVFKVANIFTADKDKIDVFLNLPSQMRMHYVLSLLVPSSGN